MDFTKFSNINSCLIFKHFVRPIYKIKTRFTHHSIQLFFFIFFWKWVPDCYKCSKIYSVVNVYTASPNMPLFILLVYGYFVSRYFDAGFTKDIQCVNYWETQTRLLNISKWFCRWWSNINVSQDSLYRILMKTIQLCYIVVLVSYVSWQILGFFIPF